MTIVEWVCTSLLLLFFISNYNSANWLPSWAAMDLVEREIRERALLLATPTAVSKLTRESLNNNVAQFENCMCRAGVELSFSLSSSAFICKCKMWALQPFTTFSLFCCTPTLWHQPDRFVGIDALQQIICKLEWKFVRVLQVLNELSEKLLFARALEWETGKVDFHDSYVHRPHGTVRLYFFFWPI